MICRYCRARLGHPHHPACPEKDQQVTTDSFIVGAPRGQGHRHSEFFAIGPNYVPCPPGYWVDEGGNCRPIVQIAGVNLFDPAGFGLRNQRDDLDNRIIQADGPIKMYNAKIPANLFQEYMAFRNQWNIVKHSSMDFLQTEYQAKLDSSEKEFQRQLKVLVPYVPALAALIPEKSFWDKLTGTFDDTAKKPGDFLDTLKWIAIGGAALAGTVILFSTYQAWKQDLPGQALRAAAKSGEKSQEIMGGVAHKLTG